MRSVFFMKTLEDEMGQLYSARLVKVMCIRQREAGAVSTTHNQHIRSRVVSRRLRSLHQQRSRFSALHDAAGDPAKRSAAQGIPGRTQGLHIWSSV